MLHAPFEGFFFFLHFFVLSSFSKKYSINFSFHCVKDFEILIGQ